MLRKTLCWTWSHRKTSLAFFLVIAFLALNALTYVHARAMTCYVATGARTGKPESLSFLQKASLIFTGVTVPRPTCDGRTPESVGLPFETHRIPGDGGVELEAWYLHSPGSRGLVLMFHGYAECKSSLLREAAAFHKKGYSACLVDFRGSGGSNGTETTIGVREADDVVAAVNYAQANWAEQKLILYGQSMGSAATLRALALRDVRPTAVVLECPFDRLVSTVANRFGVMGLPAFPVAQLLVFWGGIQHSFNGFAHNPVDYAGQVTCPVLLLHGADDRRVTAAEAKAVYDALAGPKHFELIEGAGHQSYVGRHPEKWCKVVAGFLAENAPAKPD